MTTGPDPAYAVAFSPDGRTLAVTGDGGQVMLIDSQTGKPIRKLEGLEEFAFSQAVAFSPDGRLIAAGGIPASRTARPPGLVRIWNVKTGGLTRIQVGVPSPSLSFSPDGRLLAAAGLEQDTEIHDVRTGRLVAKQRTGDFGRSVAFSPDGGVLAIGHFGGTVALISTKSWKPIGEQLDGHRARITALEFAPDGRTLMTGSADGTVRLWDTATQKPIGAPLTIATDTYLSATFSRDGSHLFAVPTEGRGVRFDVRPESWKRQACLVAGRALTRREWHDALPNRPFRSVCGP